MSEDNMYTMHTCGCATKSSESDALYHIREQCNLEAKYEAHQCSSNNFKAFKISVKAAEKEKLFCIDLVKKCIH